ncbi:Gcd10p family-domain-containing protein [Lineolata rhizophorae]|uniref:tRNA (adenine(58)-N(1))-methyltransferase non-catalytic subunit TRM6 n=1 Tax=Lineolata rhizophorae TaxID=578093 RepID=A0A6A6NZ31_9PEZI|nr:Gcd10p family-domain-containing protein [Lineolata rhizophorae]
MEAFIRPNANVVLRLPSGVLKIAEVIPNTSISIGKFGSFPANLLIGRPYRHTFDILDKAPGSSHCRLRLVPADELNADALVPESDADTREDAVDVAGEGEAEFDIVGEDGEVLMRSNRLTIDDPSRQKLSMEEIEELKKAGTGSGKEIIAKIMASHEALDEKTTFSLAKYTLRKSKKYMRRFTVLPLDVTCLAEIMLDKDFARIMDIREETMALMGSWANVRYQDSISRGTTTRFSGSRGGRWLVVDDTGGLVVAALAEKMGILYPAEAGDDASDDSRNGAFSNDGAEPAAGTTLHDGTDVRDDSAASPSPNGRECDRTEDETFAGRQRTARGPPPPSMTATGNSLTLIHANAQPNLGLLRYFSFDTSAPTQEHPLYFHLKTLSWLQLLRPEDDASYEEPEFVKDEELQTWKSNKKGTYFRKRRRWERTRRVVDETRAGEFDGLVVASVMDSVTVLKHTVPLLRGGAQTVVYSPTVESLLPLMDYYSRERRAAYIARDKARDESGQGKKEDDADFPVNPTLLVSPMLQSARVRPWQVLPGRTHPHMISRGGSEGYLFTATRVIPAEGKVEGRGKFTKRRKLEKGLDK